MTEDDLLQLVERLRTQKAEGQTIEVKEARVACPEKLHDSLSAFANQNGGGTIVFGLSEKENFSVCGVSDAQAIITGVSEQAKQMEPPLRLLFTTVQIDGKTVVSAEIPECEVERRPCFDVRKGRVRGSYVRVGNVDEPMSEYEIYSYEVFRKRHRFDMEAVEASAGTELSSAFLEQYFSKVQSTKKNLAQLTREQILQLQGICVDGKTTLAGLLLFGLYPQAAFPQLCIFATRVPGTKIGDLSELGARFTDNVRIEGTIPQMLEDALEFVRKNMRVATIVDSETAMRRDLPEYPISAVREVLLNALIHRDYGTWTRNAPIRLTMFEDRLEVESPGALYGRLTLAALGKDLSLIDTRNPGLSAAMEILSQTENRYSGIPTIRREMKNAGLPPPEFQETRMRNFLVILRNSSKTVEQTISAEAPAKSLLEFCEKPRTRKEIAEFLDMPNVKYVAAYYIRPLVKKGILAMTLPEIPRAHNQRFVTNNKNDE